MIHTVYIDDSTQKGKEILRDLHKEKNIVRFSNKIENDILPEEYMSSSEFRTAVKHDLINKLKANGRL